MFFKFQFHLVRLKVNAVATVTRTLKFQFHLVRLKAWKFRLLLVCKHISIPFSTIKSSYYIEGCPVPFQFQFHLVRLKEASVIPIGVSSGFQFHLVRLKEFAEGASRGYSYISIPFSTIKSVSGSITSVAFVYFNSI